jgi:hypothetical protein
MPTRRALLIASPDIPNDLLPGARQDVSNFETFLLSLEGGSWNRSEITKLFNPTKTDLLRAVYAMQGTDYAFITFSGHGAHHSSKELNDTSLQLTRVETCYVSEVNPQNERHTLIVDTCRALVQIKEELLKRAFAANEAVGGKISVQQSRGLFDDAFAAADAGRVVAYSCQVGQAAGESASGGVFSRALVDEASAWATQASSRQVLSVKDAFTLAQTKTYRTNAPQLPVLEAGRRLRHFPFAVSLKPQSIYG